jgi:hypothetical protein
MTSRSRIAVALATILITWTAIAGPPVWTARYLGVGQGASGMNESGEVVGNVVVAPGVRAWVASAGSGLSLLPVPEGMLSSWANDINDAGVIVGAVSPDATPEFGGRAAAWIPDGAGGFTISILGTLPGHVRSDATALNNVGDIVGFSSDGTYRSAVRFTFDSAPVDLSGTGIFDPQDVNDQRRVVDASFTVKCLDLDTMELVDLGVPAGPPAYLATRAAAINEANQVAGLAITASGGNCDRYASRYTEATGWQILSSCGYSNGCQDMNDHGDVVMRLNVAPHVRLEGIGTFPIEDLIDETDGHWYLINTFGLAINNARQMAVAGTNAITGQSGILLLTPASRAADLDGDGIVGIGDLLMMLASWGPCVRPCIASCPADLDGDCEVGIGDLLTLLADWD